MIKLSRGIISIVIVFGMFAASSATYAAKSGRSAQSQKERLVLMPLRVPADDRSLSGAMETALVEGLQNQYEVFSGEKVQQKAKDIFNKETVRANEAKKDCDETRCMQNIAEAFQAELIATANVTKRDGGYFLALSIQNIFDNKVVYSKSLPCEACNSFKVVEMLKELVVVSGSAAANVVDEVAVDVNPNDPDGALWIAADRGKSLDDYQVYLDTYPKGKYVPLAKARIKKIKDADELKSQQAWTTAQQEDSMESYALYLNSYPGTPFAALAKVRMNKLKNDVGAREESAMWKKADVSNEIAQVQGYIERYPRGRYLVLAKAKLKTLAEEAAKVKVSVMVSIPGKDYEMGKYEVTQAEWQAVMGSNPAKFKGDNLPVANVSWSDIQEYLQKLNQMTGKRYRLPKESEWEYSCVGGARNEFCGSNNVNSVAWYKNNSNDQAHQVGLLQANGYGLFDMTGNVWEWLDDCYKGQCKEHVVRGGSLENDPDDMRASQRRGYKNSTRYSDMGFRLARTYGEVNAQTVQGAPAVSSIATVSGDQTPVMITIPGGNFEIGKFEITQAEWMAVMEKNPSKFKGDNLPVESVGWNDVQEFLAKLNLKTGKDYRLPTEAEWEQACYGNNQSEYCGNDDVASVAWYENNSKNKTHPVGQMQVNSNGLFDMSGNVWEWQQDCWKGDCNQRVVRGGSLETDRKEVRANQRRGFKLKTRYKDLGFRVARTLK